jgi:acyl-CoA synthetase (AMP-forming)/AMP-acid ligase II
METTFSGRHNYAVRALEIFAEYGDREALVRGDHRLSYADLRTGVLELAVALRRHGVRPGLSVAVLITLPIEGPALQLALHLLGCRVVWITLGTPRREIEEYLRVAAPDLVVYDARTNDELARDMFGSPSSVPVLCLGTGGLGPDLLAVGPHHSGEVDSLELAADGPQSVFPTSGTTGTPKAILHGEACFRQVLDLGRDWTADGHPTMRHLSLSPLWWAAGTVATMITLSGGGLVVIQDEWSPATFLKAVRDNNINYAFLSPPMLYELLDDPALETADCSSLHMLNVGGAPSSPERLQQAADRLGPVLRVVYGLSESSYVSACPSIGADTRHPERLRSVGTPWGDVRVEIRAEDGTALGPGEVGELWVSSKLNFVEYLGNPELTAQTLVDGWLRTGDVGYRDEDAYLYLVDRTHDMIITGVGARKVFGRPIEEVLASHPGVRAAAVIGVPDPALVEVVHAYLVASGGPQPSLPELQDLVASQLPKVCVPRSVEFVDNLPVVRFGKVDKKALRARYAATGPSSAPTAPVSAPD